MTLLSQWARFAIQLLSFVILARLLSPSDFGLLAMVTAVVSFATLFADFGLSLAGIQAEFLSRDQKSNLFWLNVVAGIVASAIISALAPILAWFYDEPRVIGLTLVLASTLLINSIYVQFRVEINRAGRFGVMSLQDVVSASAGLLAAIGAAIVGAGYWALAVQLVVQSAVLLMMSVAQARWWPGRPSRRGNVKSHLKFGGNNLTVQLLNLASRTADVIALGRFQSTEALGLYSRSQQLVAIAFQQLVAPLTRVVLPRLARTTDAETFNQALISLQRPIAYGVLGAISVLFACAPSLIGVVLGADWSAMADAVRLLCIAAAFQSLGYIYYWAFLARARTGLLVTSELPGRAVMIIGAIMMAPIGIEAVAGVMVLGQAVIFSAALIASRRLGVDSRTLSTTAARPAALLVTSGVGGAWAGYAAGPNVTLSLLCSFGAWALVAALLSICIPILRRDLRGIFRALAGNE